MLKSRSSSRFSARVFHCCTLSLILLLTPACAAQQDAQTYEQTADEIIVVDDLLIAGLVVLSVVVVGGVIVLSGGPVRLEPSSGPTPLSTTFRRLEASGRSLTNVFDAVREALGTAQALDIFWDYVSDRTMRTRFSAINEMASAYGVSISQLATVLAERPEIALRLVSPSGALLAAGAMELTVEGTFERLRDSQLQDLPSLLPEAGQTAADLEDLIEWLKGGTDSDLGEFDAKWADLVDLDLEAEEFQLPGVLEELLPELEGDLEELENLIGDLDVADAIRRAARRVEDAPEQVRELVEALAELQQLLEELGAEGAQGVVQARTYAWARRILDAAVAGEEIEHTLSELEGLDADGRISDLVEEAVDVTDEVATMFHARMHAIAQAIAGFEE